MAFMMGKQYRKDFEELEKEFEILEDNGMSPEQIYAKITQDEGPLEPDQERDMWVFATLRELEGLK